MLVDVCVGTIAGPQVCHKSQGAIFKKFLAVFLVRSRIQLSLDDSLTSFSFVLETDSNYQDSSDINQWLILITWKLPDVTSRRLYMNSALLHPTQTFCFFPPFAPVIS